MADTIADLLPLWSDPPPFGHNGGPPLDEPRRVGRPTVSTPEVRARILDLLGEGVPLRVICRTSGLPGRQTVYDWRSADPEFDAACELMQQMGYDDLAYRVVEEVERALERAGPRWARYVFNHRRQELARRHPKFFGDRAMRC